MAINDHRRLIPTQWKRKDVDANEVADVLKDNVNNFRNDREQLDYQGKQQVQKETGASEHEVATKQKNDIANDRIVARKMDIAQANRSMVKGFLKKNKQRLTKNQHRKLLVNADKDFGVRKQKDALGLARIAKDEVKDLPVDSLFLFDLKKVPSKRRGMLKKQRRKTLSAFSNSKSKKLRSKSNLFQGRGKKIKMKKFKMFGGYTKAEKLQINRLRGINIKSPTKVKASSRSVARTKLVQKSRGGR